jgi:excinuclease UvrABC nuclease subunit
MDGDRQSPDRRGNAAIPGCAELPGIYRFDLGDRVYIGEADRLRRRFQHYRTRARRR